MGLLVRDPLQIIPIFELREKAIVIEEEIYPKTKKHRISSTLLLFIGNHLLERTQVGSDFYLSFRLIKKNKRPKDRLGGFVVIILMPFAGIFL